MVNKKFELTNETINFFGKKLFRIKSLIDFGGVKIGELGGFVEKEENLDIYGNAWVFGDAQVCGDGDYTTIKGFGTVFRTTTFFRCKDDEIRVNCGCFNGTLDEFRDKVKETHKDNKYAKEYLLAIDMIKVHFS